ncbi:hypothetical protein ACWGQ4_03070 [Streptomyces sp. NPDC055721]|uniref:hypothetical protein n=1 Tax=Streptomyces sp. NPDC127132 TaxID=3345374 RepID=UPI00363C3DBA
MRFEADRANGEELCTTEALGVLITRIDLAATQTALQQAALKLDFQRSSGTTSLGLIDDSRDHSRAERDARYADDLDSQHLRATEARAFVERPAAGTTLLPGRLLRAPQAGREPVTPGVPRRR